MRRIGRGLVAAAALGAILTGGAWAGRARLAEPHVIVRGTAAGVYAAPEEGAEMVTQAITGEHLVVRRRGGDWLQVTVPDGYTGWVRAGDTVPYRRGRGPLDGVTHKVLVMVPVAGVARDPGGPLLMQVTMGSELGVLGAGKGRYRVKLPTGEGWLAADAGRVLPVNAGPPRGSRADILETAGKFLGSPYVWGGTTALGIDCSGFTYRVYQVNGIKLPRDADRQFDAPGARAVDDPLPGDLVFFGPAPIPNDGGVSHVGIYLGEGEFIHASSGRGVVVNRLADPYYRDRYIGTKSYI
ncbi:MAG: C40 family peptidase [Desulfotomaculales bacterium]